MDSFEEYRNEFIWNAPVDELVLFAEFREQYTAESEHVVDTKENRMTEFNTGCYLDSHRGHYITRDVVEFASELGYIVAPFEQFALDMYETHNTDDNYPQEGIQELCDEAIQWLNSGQDKCPACLGTGVPLEGGESWVDRDGNKRCRPCTGTGQWPRISHQNFPPKVPEGTSWEFNDGDFGLYLIEDLSD